MARWNKAFGINFNDNDGGVGFFVDPAGSQDIQRHVRVFGLWRTRWIFLKRFWRAMRIAESIAGIDKLPCRFWVFNAEIPE